MAYITHQLSLQVGHGSEHVASNHVALDLGEPQFHLVEPRGVGRRDSLPAHKTRVVREYVESTEGRLSLHFLPGYAPELNPDELVWSHVKRTGTARRPLQQGEKLAGRIDQQLADVRNDPKLVRSFFSVPSVAYIRDC